jgi:hypothetical protein
MMAERTVRIDVADLGYWGPNLARNFAVLPGSELAWCCDPLVEARERAVAQRSLDASREEVGARA